MPFTSLMLGAGTLAIVGLPPFSVFIGEITILSGAVGAGMYHIALLAAVFIILAFAGMIRNVFPMMRGEPKKEVKAVKGIVRMAPMAVLLLMTLFLGLFMPEPLGNALRALAEWFTGVI
jgi:hydrogenase-4 component F